jgi:glycosyltransferase involved in cell wall biosynthesis
MRVVAMLQVYNERRFIAGCIEHLNAQGVEVYLIDDGSTDETVAIAERYLGHGVIGIEVLAVSEQWSVLEQCRRKERLAEKLDADWLIHHDADEIRVSPKPRQSLAQALAELDEAGYNAVNFLEFTFVPTREAPEHDHPGFQHTMRSYYPFLPFFPARLNAFKRQDGPVELAWSGGHRVRFDGLKMAPTSLYMRHYLFLSHQQAVEKYINRRPYPRETVAAGWHGFRLKLRPEMIELPSERELRRYETDDLLDPSNPRQRHLLDDLVAAHTS